MAAGMDPTDYLTHLRDDLDTFAGCLNEDLSVPVEHCGDWTLLDLAHHLGRGNLWAATAVTEKRSHRVSTGPHTPAELVAWFSGTATELLSTLDTDPATEAWTFFPPHTVGFWQRRRALETVIHRWDAEHALGISRALDPALASDGVAEVLDTMVPLQIKRGSLRVPPHSVRLTATDTGTSWTLGSGEPVAATSATAETLLLMLWGRAHPADQTWTGDEEAAQAVLAGPLVP